MVMLLYLTVSFDTVACFAAAFCFYVYCAKYDQLQLFGFCKGLIIFNAVSQAVQSRLKYLTSHTVNLQADEEVRDVGEDGGKPLESKDMTKESVDDASTDVTAIRADNEVSNRAPSPPPPREILRQLDLTLFVR